MTGSESSLWELIASGGVPATLLVVLLMVLREDIVTGRAYRREIERSERLNQQAQEALDQTKRLLAVVDTYAKVISDR